MALYALRLRLRLRRALALSSSLLVHNLHRPTHSLPLPTVHLISQNPTTSCNPLFPAFSTFFTSSTSTTTSSKGSLDGDYPADADDGYPADADDGYPADADGGYPADDDDGYPADRVMFYDAVDVARGNPYDRGFSSGPGTILENYDIYRWIISVEIPEDMRSQQEIIRFYENIAAEGFGSLEEAKKRIYACGTTYSGFHVECAWEAAKKFYSLPVVKFVVPEIYVVAVMRKYGGDKYVGGKIFPERPLHSPPEPNFGQQPPPEPNFRQPPPPEPSYGQPPPPQRYFGQPYPPQLNNGAPHNFPPWQNYGPPGPAPQGGNLASLDQRNYAVMSDAPTDQG